jgi:hypothetical protein
MEKPLVPLDAVPNVELIRACADFENSLRNNMGIEVNIIASEFHEKDKKGIGFTMYRLNEGKEDVAQFKVFI